MGAILENTLTFLLNQSEVPQRRIRSLYLNSYFTVVELDDASVGASMSSYRLTANHLKEREKTLRSLLKSDPLLLQFSQPHTSSDDIARSIRAATISALSLRLLCAGTSFSVRPEPPADLFSDIESAVVIGFGGYLDRLARRTNARKIHVSDLLYVSRRNEMDGKLAEYRQLRPHVQFSVSDGSDSAERLREADFASISGSTLSNDTLEPLLFAAQNCRKIVVQGQSASIHPKALFKAGVHLVVTTLKTRAITNAAFWDSTGNSLRPLLEGGLPWTYMLPKDCATAR